MKKAILSRRKKLLSVIVPVYNVEAYIRRCVDSILSQDYENIEVILVDDGSPDGCPFICDEYAKKDSRVKVIHKKNGGLSSARNAGLEIAKGEYISFVDSDDSILPGMYSEMVLAIENNGLDLVSCGMQRIKNANNIPEKKGDGRVTVFNGADALVDCLSNDGAAVWCKLYTKKAIGDVRFPLGRIFEDSATMYLFIANSDKVGHLNRTYYNYFYNGNSITQTSFKPKSRWDYVLARKEAYEYAIENKIPCIRECKSLYVKSLLSCLTAVYACGSPDEKVEYISMIIPELVKYRDDKDCVSRLNMKYRIWLRLSGRLDFVHKLGAKISLFGKRIRKLVLKLRKNKCFVVIVLSFLSSIFVFAMST